MYSWDPNPSDWRGKSEYNFGDDRREYFSRVARDSAAAGPRTYSRRHDADLALVGTHNKTIQSDSKNPIIIATDVTGSMSTWPAEIFDRLPLIYQTLVKYREDVEICFAAIGDAFSDKYPIQVNNFGKDLELEKQIKALCPEGGGGGGARESYELFAYYMNTHVVTPNAEKPFLIIFGDEGFYDKIDKRQVKHYIGDDLGTELDSMDVFHKVANKFNAYLLHKQYGSPTHERHIVDQWGEAFTDQKIIHIPEAQRAVDTAIGLIARSWGEYADFHQNMLARHDESEIAGVHEALDKVVAKLH